MRIDASFALVGIVAFCFESTSPQIAFSGDGIESAQLAYDQWNLAPGTLHLSQSGFRKVKSKPELDYTKESQWSVHNQECVLSGLSARRGQQVSEAFLRNDQYSATLRENTAGKWTVRELVVGKYNAKSYAANSEKRNARDEVLNTASNGTPLRTPWQILPGNDDFIMCIRNGIVKISNWSRDSEGREIANFTFENNDISMQGKGVVTFHGEYKGIPLRAEIEFNAPDGTVGKSFVENSDFCKVDKFVFPKKWRRWSERNGNITAEEEWVIKQFALPSSIPRSTFTLTAFGLPEPPGTTVLHTPFPYWLIGTIGGVMLIAVGFYLRNRKT